MEDLTPFRRRFLSLGYSKGLMYPKIIALFYPSIEFVASNLSLNILDMIMVRYIKREKRTEYRADRHTVSGAL